MPKYRLGQRVYCLHNGYIDSDWLTVKRIEMSEVGIKYLLEGYSAWQFEELIYDNVDDLASMLLQKEDKRHQRETMRILEDVNMVRNKVAP